jgi:hypothetical protein
VWSKKREERRKERRRAELASASPDHMVFDNVLSVK